MKARTGSTTAEDYYRNMGTFPTVVNTEDTGSDGAGNVKASTTDENIYGNSSTTSAEPSAPDGGVGDPTADGNTGESVNVEESETMLTVEKDTNHTSVETENIYKNS